MLRDICPERLALLPLVLLPDLVAQLVLPDGYILHLRRDNPLPCIIHLRNLPSRLCHPRARVHVLETQAVQRPVRLPHPPVLRAQPLQPLRVPPLLNPPLPHLRQPLLQIHPVLRVAVRTRRVIHHHVLILHPRPVRVHRRRHLNPPHRHPQVLPRARHVNLLRTGQRPGRHFKLFHILSCY